MPPDYHRPDDLWNQATEVLPIVDGYEPPEAAPAASSGKRSPASRYTIIGLSAVLAALLLITAGLFAAKHFRPNTETATAATTQRTTPAPTTSAAGPATPPAAGAPLASVVAWVQAGKTVDVTNYHTATTSDGTINNLGSAVAFVSPTKKIQCMTQKQATTVDQGGLSCMVALDNPPSRPTSRNFGNWVGGWVDYPGERVGVGAVKGDPGQFLLGDGPALAYGSRITFDDFDCRMDQTGLFCVNKSAESALQLSSSGAVPFGCLGAATAQNYGIEYSCGGAAPTTTTTTTTKSNGPVALGESCDTAGQQAKAASGAMLTCDAAGDSGLRWLNENKPVSGSSCSAGEAGTFGYTANGKLLMCSSVTSGRVYAWGDPGTLVDGQHQSGESCAGSQEGKVAKSATGTGLFCMPVNGSPGKWAWRAPS
ncbi:hypothetical protein [Nocardia sp. NPDC056100]|uniref:hypothetical protein n=1 Tax=Nocardia sp. NPDC056100 TaxID=3345712 RepID=UPI0035D67049